MHAVRGRLGGGLLPPYELTEAAGEAIEVFLALVLGHASRECSANGDHDRGVGADQEGLGAVGVLVGLFDEVFEAVSYAVVKLRDTFAFSTRNDGWSLWCVQVVEVAIEFGDVCWGRVIEAGETVELANTGFGVDLDLLAFGQSGREGLQSLEAAVEGRAVDQVDWRIEFHEMLAKLLRLQDSIARESWIGDDACR